MIYFYSSQIENSPFLSESESLHCCRVLRMKQGDLIHVIDGIGSLYKCEIIKADPKKTEIKIIDLIKTEKRDYNIILAIAPTKNSDRMEWMVEKCVEIGIDEIVFIKCKRSERKEIKLERLEKVAVSAMKQSLKCRLPKLYNYDSLSDFFKNIEPDYLKYMGYCSQEFPKEPFVKNLLPNRDVMILIGPEGDFAIEEVNEAVDNGFIPVTFGDTRLRTETAGLYAVTAVHIINELNAP